MLRDIIEIVKYTDSKYIKKQLYCMFLLIVNMILSLAYPGCISFVVDHGIVQKNIFGIIKFVLLVLIIGAFLILSNYLYQVQCSKLGRKISGNLRNSIFQKLCRMNYKFWNDNRIGDILTIIDVDISTIEKLITTSINNGLLNICIFLGITVILICYEAKIGILTSGLAIFFAMLQRKNGCKIEAGMIKLRKKIGELNSYNQEVLSNMPDIGLVYSEHELSRQYIKKNMEMNNAYLNQVKNMLGAKSLGMFFNILAVFLSLLIGAYDVMTEKITIGTLFSIVVYVQQLYSPVLAVGESYNSLKNGHPIIKKVVQLLNNQEEIHSGEYLPLGPLNGNIEFKDVTFSYKDSKRKIIEHLNMSLESGKIYAITGSNGVGKSTLIRLIAGLCTPQSGKILIDGILIEDYERNYLQEHIGYLLQKPYILSDRLKELNFNNMNETFILPEILTLKENSKGISGGENQKLAIINLIQAVNKDIYILDEPTSAIDLKTEKNICSIIKEKLSGKTVLIITHRPEILKICDEVITLSG